LNLTCLSQSMFATSAPQLVHTFLFTKHTRLSYRGLHSSVFP